MKRIRAVCVALTGIALLCGGNVVGQSVPAAVGEPIRNITAPGAQRPGNPPSQPQRQSPAARAPQPIRQSTGAGTIEGFVYWDASQIAHKPASSCRGLAITVSVGSNSGGPLTAYTPLGTLSNNFKYVGQVKQFVAGGKVNAYEVCTFGYDKVPVGPNLQVKVSVIDPNAFSPSASPQIAILGPIQIVNGQCNMLPRITNPSASDLFAHWGSCQNMAFDVNFAMQSPRVANASGVASMPVISSTQTGMLSGSSQQGMLESGSKQNAQSKPGSGALSGNHQSVSIRNGGAQNPAAKVELNPQPLPPRVQMANADVLKMLKSRVPESVILSQIGSSIHKFDFSPTGCRQLQDAHATRQVLDAMGDGSVHPCLATQGNAKNSARASVPVVHLAAPTALKKAANPRLAQQNSEIIAVLEKQHQTSRQQFSDIKLTRPASATVSMARVPAASGFKGSGSLQAIGTEKTQSASANPNTSLIHAPWFNNIVVTCTNDPTPRILQVGGGEAHGVFTPEPKYNLYTITGCSFGQTQGTAHIFASNGFSANLNIDFWSENGITAHLDPALAGVTDQDNVTLVVVLSGSQQIQKSGFKFYATRGMPGPDGSDQEVPLAYDSTPQSNVTLYDASPIVAAYNQVPQNGASKFPSFSFQGTPVSGWVFRYAYGHDDSGSSLNLQTADSCFINDVSYSGPRDGSNVCVNYFQRWQKLSIDTWDFSRLAPGFLISSYQLYYENTDAKQLCGSWDDTAKQTGLLGGWDFNLTPQNQITVVWPVYWCRDDEATPFDRQNQQEQSAYGLAVWVMGPRCVDAWTGQKDQNCIGKLKQMLD